MSTVTVAEIMTIDPVTVKPSDALAKAREEMELSEIRHLPVVDKGKLVGLLSQRDIATYRGPSDVKVRDLMRTDVASVGPQTSAHEAAYLILRRAIGSVPVVDDSGLLVGIVTDTDFVRAAYTLLGGQVPIEELLAEEHEADNV